MKAIAPDGQRFPLPELHVLAGPETHRFLPNGKGLVALQGFFRNQNFWLLDFETGKLRQLTDLQPGASIRSFDVSPDSKQIVFDRVRENSDIVLIDLSQDVKQ